MRRDGWLAAEDAETDGTTNARGIQGKKNEPTEALDSGHRRVKCKVGRQKENCTKNFMQVGTLIFLSGADIVTRAHRNITGTSSLLGRCAHLQDDHLSTAAPEHDREAHHGFLKQSGGGTQSPLTGVTGAFVIMLAQDSVLLAVTPPLCAPTNDSDST